MRPILLPGIIGVAMAGFTGSYDEFARTALTIGSANTLPLEIMGLTTSAAWPVLFALGTLTTAVSFAVIAMTVAVTGRMVKRRAMRSAA